MDVLRRLARVVRSTTTGKLDELEKIVTGGRSFLEDRLDEWEKRLNIEQEEEATKKSYSEGASGKEERFSPFPSQVVQDLDVFGLKPPSSFEEVKKVRKREIKKYHSDLFMHDPEKQELAKQVMQIYNSAFERLKKYYTLTGKG